jgi:hypothetical protein
VIKKKIPRIKRYSSGYRKKSCGYIENMEEKEGYLENIVGT